jgi:hypothetical protein
MDTEPKPPPAHSMSMYSSSADYWKADAKRYAENAAFWRWKAESAEKDAELYRWLRDNTHPDNLRKLFNGCPLAGA